MKILIVDDDIPKLNELKEFVLKYVGDEQITYRQSYQSGLKEIMVNSPEIVLLDMSMPTYDSSTIDRKGGRPRPFAGLDILKEIRRKKLLTKVIVVTQYAILKSDDKDEKTLEELTLTLQNDFRDNFIGTVFYKYSEDGWQKTLDVYLTKLIGENKDKQ